MADVPQPPQPMLPNPGLPVPIPLMGVESPMAAPMQPVLPPPAPPPAQPPGAPSLPPPIPQHPAPIAAMVAAPPAPAPAPASAPIRAPAPARGPTPMRAPGKNRAPGPPGRRIADSGPKYARHAPTKKLPCCSNLTEMLGYGIETEQQMKTLLSITQCARRARPRAPPASACVPPASRGAAER